MPSKLKQRRLRRLKADLAWWREEAEDCRSRLLELAGEIDSTSTDRQSTNAGGCPLGFNRRNSNGESS